VSARAQTANMARVPQPGPVIPPAPTFALTPAALFTAPFIDLNSTEGRKSFNTAIKPLDVSYDGTKLGLQMFIHQVSTRAAICGWSTTILSVPTIADPNVSFSLLSQYGQLTVLDVMAHAATYASTQTKRAQDSMALKLFLDGSLDNKLMLRVIAKRQEYTTPDGIESGPAMFRIILSIVGIETSASIAVINSILRTLPKKMSELKSDIVAFNEFVMEQCNELTSRGHEPYGLVYLLFDAYLSTSNDHFKEYMRAKESAVYDGSVVITYQALMSVAEERYKIMKSKGEWTTTKVAGAPTTDDHIIALRAEIQALQAINNGPKKATNGSGAATARRGNTGKYEWKDKPPKGNESKFKDFEGRLYCHCPNHKGTKWVLADGHKDGCTLDANWKYPTEPTKAATSSAAASTYAAALMHVIDEDEVANMMGEENI
jgi:hypothetical protein